MERRNNQFQMLNELIIPIVLICAFVPGEINTCSTTTAIDRHELDPVTLPSECLMRGSEDAAKIISEYNKEHPNKQVDFRIICKRNSEKT